MDTSTRNMAAFAAVIVLIAAALFFMQPKAAADGTATPTPAPEDLVIRAGDTVELDYTVFVENGSVYDTSLESVARSAGIYKEGLLYKPFSFTVGSGQVIAGMDNAVKGMRRGEEKNFTVAPAEGYGDYSQDLLAVMPRNYSVNRVETVTMSDFRAVFPGFDFTSETVVMGSWNATIISATNSSVTLRHDPGLNQTIETGSWLETVIGLNETSILMKRDPVIGRQYVIRDQAGSPKVAIVRDVKDDYILLDYNAPLAGHTLNFTVKIAKITRLSS